MLVYSPSEGCVNGMFSGGVGSTGIIPGVFALVTRRCVCGAKHICVCPVGGDDDWVVCVGVDGTWSAVATNIFLICVQLPHGVLGIFESHF